MKRDRADTMRRVLSLTVFNFAQTVNENQK